MSRRAILAISAALSAFVLVLAGAAASYAWRPAPQPSAAQDVIPTDVVRAREASYQRVIEEANRRLRAQQAATAPPIMPDPTETPSPAVAEERAEKDERHHDHHERTARREEDDDG